MKAHRHFGGRHGGQLVLGAATAVNALGFSAYETWASRRAELTGYGESPFRLPNGERATLAFVPTLVPTSFGGVRMLVLLDRTLAPLVAQLVAAFGTGVRAACAIALPERMDGHDPVRRFDHERRQLQGHAQHVFAQHGLAPQVDVYPRGHAAGAMTLMGTLAALEANTIDVAVVGGVDTYYDPDVMDRLMLEQRVFCNGSLDAIIPGEAASFALIARSSALRAAGLPALCRVETVSLGEEPCRMGLRVPNMGLGLTRTLLPIRDRLHEERRTLDWILGDVTNEDYRAHELQLAFPRFVRDVVKGEIPMEFLPMAMGDLGAASLPTALAIAAEAFSRGDPRAETCLMFAASVGEDRGGVLASSITEGV